MKGYYSIFLLTFSMLTASFSSFSQQWVEMMKDPNANFYNTRDAFNAYWAGKTIQKGKGYKAFRRWEHYMAPRVYPSGDVKLASQTYKNYKQWEADLAAAGTPKSTTGNWMLMGPTGKPTGGGAGRVNFVRFDPANSATMWIGTPDGGLWKSTNSGTTFTTNTDQLATIGCSDIAIDPTNSNIIYLATGDNDGSDTYSIGVLKSTDGGLTWNTTSLTWTASQGRNIGRLLINPTNPQIIMAFSNVGIWRSTNGGSTWMQPTGGTSTFSCSDAEFKPGDPNTIYAAGTTFKKSTDGGVTWTASTLTLTGIGRLAIGVSEANAAYVYLLAANNTDNGAKGVMRSTDSGVTFTTRMTATSTTNILGYDNGADAGGQGWYDLCIDASPTNAEEIMIGGINVWKSTNGGTSFTLNTHWTGSYSKPYIHSDIHDIQYLPGSGTTIYAGNDGGLFKTTNSGTAWSDISTSLAIAQQYRIGLSTSNANLWLAGHQDNGTNRYNGTTWAQVYSGDGMDCFIDRTNNNIMYGSYIYGDYYKSTNGGTSFTAITTGLPVNTGAEEWLCAWHQDPTTATTIYAGGRTALYKTTNSGTSWSALGTPTGTGNILEFAIAPSNNQVIYALKTGTNAVSKSTNGGTSFTACATGLPTALTPTYIAISNTDPNVAIVTYSGYTATSKVYKTTNGGTSWTNLSTGLPNIPANCVVYENGSTGGDGIYVGTDLGVYFRDNSMTTWVDFSSGLPNCAVSDLEIYYDVANSGANKRLRAATFGRGTWDSDLYSSVPTVPIASFIADNVNICVGQTVQFTSTSSGIPTSYSWTFNGGSPATSTSQNPSVTYNTAGTYDVSLYVSNANGQNTSTQTGYITVSGASTNTLSVSEGFTSTTFPPNTPAQWNIINTDGGTTTWARSASVGVAPSGNGSMVFDNYNFDDSGNSDEMRLPKLNFSGYSSAQMTFDVAYAPFTQNGQIFADGLQVVVSSDCGTTWNTVYDKAGTTVATGNLPTISAVTTQFTPSSTQWRQETIDLSSYLGQSNVIIAFKNIAAYGNALFIDNINLTGTAIPTPPIASFTSTPSSTACTGHTIQYTSTSTGFPTTYSWTFNGGTPTTSTAQNPTVTYATTGTYDVSLTVTNSLGSNTSNQTNFININQSPSITATIPADRCGAGSVTLNATASSGTLSWFSVATGGTALGTGSSFTTPSLSSSSTYFVEAFSNGCTSIRTAVLATINNPIVTNPGNSVFCLGNASSAINFTGNNSSIAYTWSNDNTLIGLTSSGSGNISSFIPSSTGLANISVTPTLNGCTGQSISFTITVNDCNSGIDNITDELLIIYPNPTNGLLSVKGESLSKYNKMELIDVTGRIVGTWSISGNPMNIDLSNFSTGSYNLKISGNNIQTLKKIEIKK